MAQEEAIVIRDDNGVEHEFPAGFGRTHAIAVVRVANGLPADTRTTEPNQRTATPQVAPSFGGLVSNAIEDGKSVVSSLNPMNWPGIVSNTGHLVKSVSDTLMSGGPSIEDRLTADVNAGRGNDRLAVPKVIASAAYHHPVQAAMAAVPVLGSEEAATTAGVVADKAVSIAKNLPRDFPSAIAHPVIGPALAGAAAYGTTGSVTDALLAAAVERGGGTLLSRVMKKYGVGKADAVHMPTAEGFESPADAVMRGPAASTPAAPLPNAYDTTMAARNHAATGMTAEEQALEEASHAAAPPAMPRTTNGGPPNRGMTPDITPAYRAEIELKHGSGPGTGPLTPAEIEAARKVGEIADANGGTYLHGGTPAHTGDALAEEVRSRVPADIESRTRPDWHQDVVPNARIELNYSERGRKGSLNPVTDATRHADGLLDYTDMSIPELMKELGLDTPANLRTVSNGGIINVDGTLPAAKALRQRFKMSGPRPPGATPVKAPSTIEQLATVGK